MHVYASASVISPAASQKCEYPMTMCVTRRKLHTVHVYVSMQLIYPWTTFRKGDGDAPCQQCHHVWTSDCSSYKSARAESQLARTRAWKLPKNQCSKPASAAAHMRHSCSTDKVAIYVMIHAWVPVPCIHVPVRAYLWTLDHASNVSS